MVPSTKTTSSEATSPETAVKSSALIPEVVPGVELSTEYQGKDVHILGLFIDHHNDRFLEYLRNFVASRDTRNYKMCALLQETGMGISYEKLLNAFPGSVITRAHYAKYMLAHGYVKSMAEAFERYVGDRCPYFVPREKVTPAQAVELILHAGGIPILAHPILYHMSDARLDCLVGELRRLACWASRPFTPPTMPAMNAKSGGWRKNTACWSAAGPIFMGTISPALIWAQAMENCMCRRKYWIRSDRPISAPSLLPDI